MALGDFLPLLDVLGGALFGEDFGDGLGEVGGGEAFADVALDAVGHFVGGGAVDDVLDERAAREVAEVEGDGVRKVLEDEFGEGVLAAEELLGGEGAERGGGEAIGEEDAIEMDGKDAGAGIFGGAGDANAAIDAAGPGDGFVEGVGTVGGEDDEGAGVVHAVHFGEQGGDEGEPAVAGGAALEEGVGFVKEQDGGVAAILFPAASGIEEGLDHLPRSCRRTDREVGGL